MIVGHDTAAINTVFHRIASLFLEFTDTFVAESKIEICEHDLTTFRAPLFLTSRVIKVVKDTHIFASSLIIVEIA
jgi:hypothetical protein